MRNGGSIICVLVLAAGAATACGTSRAAQQSGTSASQTIDASGDGVHEYRAVCTEKDMHGGSEYVLSKWLDTKNQAKAIGDYHGEFKYKGHQIRIEERVKKIRR